MQYAEGWDCTFYYTYTPFADSALRARLSITYRYIDTGRSNYLPLVTFLILTVLNFGPFICFLGKVVAVSHYSR